MNTSKIEKESAEDYGNKIEKNQNYRRGSVINQQAEPIIKNMDPSYKKASVYTADGVGA